MVTTARYEEPVQVTPSKTTRTTKEPSYDSYPDFPLTFLNPTLNGKFSSSGLKSYSQVRLHSAGKDAGPHYPEENMPLAPASLTSHTRHITEYGTTIPSTTILRSTIPSTSPAHWLQLVSVQVYPKSQALVAGYDAVLQCRDEGQLRGEVFWQRGGGRQLPTDSSQERGRLEILGVTPEDEGDYECVAEGHEHEDGGKQISTLFIQK